ncbi:hypothetical protein FGO68_gene13870 [Halteria grandinella]|uniref:Uncharacterized protein n=1 Tax=Halteria grandinella TaxID=5974 RepID=A0A8J8NXE2_HALGN|nr:hypothetical protein FGO68_gene13870 [Halteria grandinella]
MSMFIGLMSRCAFLRQCIQARPRQTYVNILSASFSGIGPQAQMKSQGVFYGAYSRTKKIFCSLSFSYWVNVSIKFTMNGVSLAFLRNSISLRGDCSFAFLFIGKLSFKIFIAHLPLPFGRNARNTFPKVPSPSFSFNKQPLIFEFQVYILYLIIIILLNAPLKKLLF